MHSGLEAQERYFSSREILAAIVSHNHFELVFVAHRTIIARYVAKWGIALVWLCETKYQGGGGIAPFFRMPQRGGVVWGGVSPHQNRQNRQNRQWSRGACWQTCFSRANVCCHCGWQETTRTAKPVKTAKTVKRYTPPRPHPPFAAFRVLGAATSLKQYARLSQYRAIWGH